MDAPLLTYADRRALNIARNAERMRAIGLTTIRFADLGPTALAQKQKRLSETSDIKPLVNLQLRRSARTSGVECAFFAHGIMLMPPIQACMLPTMKLMYTSNLPHHSIACDLLLSRAVRTGFLLPPLRARAEA